MQVKKSVLSFILLTLHSDDVTVVNWGAGAGVGAGAGAGAKRYSKAK